jgi:uncharacterized LabA/DUF88 family protein
MSRYVVMVDAGYLLRQAIEIASQRASKRRAELVITDPAGLVGMLLRKSENLLALEAKELLRVYWYDGVNAGGLTAQQKSLVHVDDVQFRAGTINAARQQKGVDSLIVTDLIELTSHHAISDAILVTGDSDLAIGLEIVQKRGVRVAVVGVEDLGLGVTHHQSFEIISRADRVGCIGGSEIIDFVRYEPAPAVVVNARTTVTAATAEVVVPETGGVGIRVATAEIVQTSTHQEHATQPGAPQRSASTEPLQKQAIFEAVEEFVRSSKHVGVIDASTRRIQAQTDRILIHAVYEKLASGALSMPQKNYAREVFRDLLSRV